MAAWSAPCPPRCRINFLISADMPTREVRDDQLLIDLYLPNYEPITDMLITLGQKGPITDMLITLGQKRVWGVDGV